MAKQKEKVEVYFVTTWDESIVLEHELREQTAKVRFGLDNILMKRWHSWRY